MLKVRTLLCRDGIEIADVACMHARGRGAEGEQIGGYSLVFVRRGSFIRSADGVESVLDPTLAYCMNPGEAQRYDHHHDHGDDCTSLSVDAGLLASIWGGEPRLPRTPLPTSPTIDLAHRIMLGHARRGADPHELVERAVALTAGLLAQADARRVASGRPATLRARRALVDDTRAALAERPERSLSDLALALAVSPHHLSRVFHASTGHTIARHRMRLRARTALERLAGGEESLGRIAAEAGFADQSHLCRVLRRETGHAPSALRDTLS